MAGGDDSPALVDRFAELARAAVAAEDAGRFGDARRLRRDMRAVAAEIGGRSPDASALEPLCDDPVIGSLASEACNDIVNDSWWLEREPAEHGGLPALGSDELQPLSSDALLVRFAVFAVEYEGADGTPPYEDLYYQIDDIQREFERRGEPRALLALYTHADVRVRALAAQWTMSAAPELARDRLGPVPNCVAEGRRV